MTDKSTRLPRSVPEAQGLASDAVLSFIAAADRETPGLHSVMVLRHGHVVAEGWWAPHGPSIPHVLYSLSKSFTSTAIGLVAAEGYLTVDNAVISFFPEESPNEISANLAAMRVKDLLTMTTGHDQDPTGRVRNEPDGNWAQRFLALPVEHAPGSHFAYNSAATYMLSAIVQKITGQTLLDYLSPLLFAPLGIANPTWDSSPQGVNTGGWGLSITTEDIACFGQLYLQQGEWRGEQLVPAAWVAEATSKQVSNGSDPENDWNQGYGYQFWRCTHNSYRGDGAFGQFCIVMPDADAVVAITAKVSDLGAVLRLVWKYLLAEMQSSPLPAAPDKHNQLLERLSRLVVRDENGSAREPLA